MASPVKVRKAQVAVKLEKRPMTNPFKKAAPKKATRVTRGPSGRLYGGESAAKYSPLGTKHYAPGDDYGAGNRMYGQDRPKKAPVKRAPRGGR